MPNEFRPIVYSFGHTKFQSLTTLKYLDLKKRNLEKHLEQNMLKVIIEWKLSQKS